MGATRDAIRAVLDDLAARIGELDAIDDVPDGVGAGLVDAGIVRLLAPRRYGGTDGSLVESMEILEEIATVDASVAWRSLVACEVAPVLARLPELTLEALYAGGPDFVGGALFAPKGTAVEVPGGYRVRGRWPNATGCDRCVWLCGMCMVVDAKGEIRRTRNGAPMQRVAVFPAANSRRASTWHTTGLRAAGGHDVVVDDVFVPADRTFDLFAPVDHAMSRVAVLPVATVFAMHAGAVALGVATGALADATSPGSSTVALARSRTTLSRARTALYEQGARLDAACDARGQAAVGMPDRVGARATSSWVVAAAGSIVSTALESGGGGSGLVEGGDGGSARTASLARRFRDVHALSQHIALIQDHLNPGGALLVGAELAVV